MVSFYCFGSSYLGTGISIERLLMKGDKTMKTKKAV